MRTPYVVGRWVRGQNHYGRERVIDYLLHGPESAVWLVGTRRMGKTSLLRQLELIAITPGSQSVPLVWDLQGCRTPAELSAELVDSIVDVRGRFEGFGVSVSAFDGQDALVVLRNLTRVLDQHGMQLLVLIDEAEALINVAEVDPAWVGRLRRALQDPRQRTVMTSTKVLARLNNVPIQWSTSPFLFGFGVVTLPRLEEAASRALVRQTQADVPVLAGDGEVDDVLIHTDGQPYLTQLLCNRLFTTNAQGEGCLRSITDDDLVVDHVLDGLFRIDYEHLVRSERRLLLAVADLTIAKETELVVRLSDLAPNRIRMFLFGLERAGLLRRVFGQWAVGNEFLRRWVSDHFDELEQQLADAEDDGLHESVLEVGREHEAMLLRREIARIESLLVKIEEELETASGDDQLRLLEVAARLRRELARIRNELAAIEDGA